MGQGLIIPSAEKGGMLYPAYIVTDHFTDICVLEEGEKWTTPSTENSCKRSDTYGVTHREISSEDDVFWLIS